MYKLLIEDDEGGKTAVSLIRDEITIGRKEGNTIRLTERNVSRRHGRILRENGQVFIEDVSARYGIKKNGKKIQGRAEIKEGDVVFIGDYRLTLQPEVPKKSGAKPKARAPGNADPRKETQITDLNELGAMTREDTQLMQALPAKLVVISSNFAGEEFPLHQKEIVIGSGDDCNIIIDHLSVSRKHAKIVREGHATYKIVDLNSKNGVKVSGDSYRATHLKRGDVVELGHVKFRFVEAGENYVFTPQSAPELVGAAPKGSSGKMIGGLVAGVLVALLIGGGLFILGRSSEEGGGADSGPNLAAVGDNSLSDLALGDLSEGDERIDGEIERAGQRIDEGQLQRAIGTLETLQSMALSAEQQEKVNELLATAQAELPFKRVYDGALEAMSADDYLVALDYVMELPSHSVFYSRMEEENAFEEIFAGVVQAGYEDIEAGNYEAARGKAEEVLTARDGYPKARQLLADANRREEEAAMVASRRDIERSRPAGSGARTQQAPARRPAAQPRVSAEEARELFTSAARKVAGGNPQGAVDDCTRAVRAGNTDCHRILGLAYAQLGNNAQACQHLERYLATGPSNPAAIESQMDRLGCGQ